jgi:hypothetical protein
MLASPMDFAPMVYGSQVSQGRSAGEEYNQSGEHPLRRGLLSAPIEPADPAIKPRPAPGGLALFQRINT